MNRLIPILINVILLFTAHSALSQGIWKTYTRADGLAGDTVYCINQDKFGNMWFGTRGAGLSKLDTNGIWTNFLNDSTTYIYDIEIDNINNKWLALGRSGKTWVVKFDDVDFTYYSPTGSPKYDPKPRCLGQDSSGHIWCGMNYGVAYCFDGFNWNFVEIIPPWAWSVIREIKMDRQGTLYFAHDQGISVMKEHPYWIWGGAVTSDLCFDRQNRLWFTLLFDEPRGLGMFDGNSWRLWSTSDGLLDNDVWAVAVDSSNHVWIAYITSPPYLGISKFDGIKFNHFNYEQGLAHKNVWDIYIDKKGLIWLATDGGGVFVLKDTTTTCIDQSNKIDGSEKIFSLFQNYPNPFNSSTFIRYNLLNESKVELSIYNLLGKEVRSLIKKYQQPGEHQVVWNGTDNYGKEVSSGIYFAILKTKNFKQSLKLSLIR